MSERFDDLMREASDLPKGPLRVGVLEEAVREADRLGDERRGYLARWELVHVAEFSGQDDRGLVAFTWCLGYADRLGDDFPNTRSLLWRYKWIARDLVDFPNISREQIEEVERDLEERFERHGYGLRAVFGIRWLNAFALGDDERAVPLFHRWMEMPRDELSDCRACDADSVVHFHVNQGENEEALRHAAPLLAGQMECASVPHVTYANVLEPLSQLGRYEEADRHQKRGYRMISRDTNFLSTTSDHLDYLVRRGVWDRALRLFERHLGWRLASNVPSDHFYHDLSAQMLFEGLVERGNRPRKLRLPADFPLQPDDDGRLRPSELVEWFAESTTDLAARFDARNGNRHFSEIVENVRGFTRGGE